MRRAAATAIALYLAGVSRLVAAPTLVTEAEASAGISTEGTRAGALQLRALGEVATLRFHIAAALSGTSDEASSAFGAGPPYDGRPRLLEAWIEKPLGSAQKLATLRVGRFRIP